MIFFTSAVQNFNIIFAVKVVVRHKLQLFNRAGVIMLHEDGFDTGPVNGSRDFFHLPVKCFFTVSLNIPWSAQSVIILNLNRVVPEIFNRVNLTLQLASRELESAKSAKSRLRPIFLNPMKSSDVVDPMGKTSRLRKYYLKKSGSLVVFWAIFWTLSAKRLKMIETKSELCKGLAKVSWNKGIL